jgi:single-strand DNA-binding protein
VGFFDVETWAKLAENCYNLGRKGRGIRVVGRLKQDRWAGADGKPRSRVTIVAEHVEFRPDLRKNEEQPQEYPDEITEAETAEIPSQFAAISEEALEAVTF